MGLDAISTDCFGERLMLLVGCANEDSSAKALENGSVILDEKDGVYEPLGRRIYLLCN